jgi:hypothetical protein
VAGPELFAFPHTGRRQQDVTGLPFSGHALTHPFAVFGYHVTGSTGTLFLGPQVINTLI